MRGDRVEAVVDTGQGGTQTFEIVATRAGRRIEVTTARGVVEVSEVTRGGTPVRTGRFMASRLVALVEHPAAEGRDRPVDVSTRRRMRAGSTEEVESPIGGGQTETGCETVVRHKRRTDERAYKAEMPYEGRGYTMPRHSRIFVIRRGPV